MSLNPHMKVFICSGIYDLITPFFAVDRLANLMKLDTRLKEKLTVKQYSGGHMFYTWATSRAALHADMRAFYE